jgi:hypothetical protein
MQLWRFEKSHDKQPASQRLWDVDSWLRPSPKASKPGKLMVEVPL